MLIVADVHGAFRDLARVVNRDETVLILGDLINFVDYRTGEGMIGDVFGAEFVDRVTKLRALGDHKGSRDQWRLHSEGREDEVMAEIASLVVVQYQEMTVALEGGRGFVIHGNVDVPDLLRSNLPSGFTYMDGEVAEIEGWRVGFIAGGAATAFRGRGEVPEEVIASRLDDLGDVDILCSHIPPAIDPLRSDVITGRREGSSEAILQYIRDVQPRYHFFGDVHQPQATRWRVGETICRNVGYFRATRRAVEHL